MRAKKGVKGKKIVKSLDKLIPHFVEKIHLLLFFQRVQIYNNQIRYNNVGIALETPPK